MNKFYYHNSVTNYTKALARLEKSIRSGKFVTYTQQKKREIWNRLCRYARQLGIKIKAPVAAACIAAGLSFVTPANAQPFVQQTGAANPFNGVNVGFDAAPAFVDIDGDGDKDAFVGVNDGTIRFYKNTGTSSAPVLAEQTGAANPFDGVIVGQYSVPTFVDIDNDGDNDAFIGTVDGTLRFYKNTGSASAPVFTEQTGAANPFNGVDVGYTSSPTFADIDGDGDQDALVGAYDGTIRYFKNTGTSSAPVFAEQIGAANPLNGATVGYASTPAFADVDGDGDLDVFVGDKYGNISYYKNTGTSTAAVFTAQTGANNFFNGINVGYYSVPTFVDIDNDGDLDAFIGADDGTVNFYKNNAISLPLRLISFSGTKEAGHNRLQWQTADEINTKKFEIQTSTDGHLFTKLTSVNAAGKATNKYAFNDNSLYTGKVFYRLKMVDVDDRFTYSQVIWIKNNRDALITLFPNPAKDILNLNIASPGILQTKAAIYDGNGRLVQNIIINVSQQQINTQSFAKGKYVIKFADGSTQSFIKE